MRRFRFSLRAALILIAVAAIVLGWFSYHKKWIHDRNEARKWIFTHRGLPISGDTSFIVTRPDGSQVKSNDGLVTTDGKLLKDFPKAPLSLRLLGEPSVRFVFLSGVAGEGNPPIDFAERNDKLPELRRLFPQAEFVVFPPEKAANCLSGLLTALTLILPA
jgi:hypothetical protein